MAKDDDTFRQERPKIKPEEIGARPQEDVVTPDAVMAIRKQAGLDVPDEFKDSVYMSRRPVPEAQNVQFKPKDGIQVAGRMPPAMKEMLEQRIAEVESGTVTQQFPESTSTYATHTDEQTAFEQARAREIQREAAKIQARQQQHHQEPGRARMEPQLPPTHSLGVVTTNDPALNELLQGLQTQIYEPVTLPSRGNFYSPDATGVPSNGILHLRPMTGQDESILTTVRFMRYGRGIEMIFKNCLSESHINTEKLLSVDRTYLLIYLRAISFGNLYDVRVTCPDCSHHFDQEVDLNLPLKYCPDDFNTESLTKTLPESGYKFHFRLMTGEDEQKVIEHRDKVARGNANTIDDTALFRCSLLIEWIGNEKTTITDKAAIRTLLLQLPARDTNFLRNNVGDTPFGPETKIGITCPSCFHEFEVEMPYDANFFFPQEKESSVLV